jgi:hypothetical protein
MLMFPNGRFDDQVDSTAQALAWTKQRPPGWGIFEYYRLLAEKARGEDTSVLVRIRVPEGITHVQTMSGQNCMVRDRMIEVSENDAAPLLTAGFSRL